eukprot:scaffold33192_cov16-Tisochrysis_lutea.AAC.1
MPYMGFQQQAHGPHSSTARDALRASAPEAFGHSHPPSNRIQSNTSAPVAHTSASEALLQPMPPSSDWVKLQQRVSGLRAALTVSQQAAGNYKEQVEGLTTSLQAKHEENCYLQLQLMTAAQNMQLMGGQLQGQIGLAQDGVVLELQEELQAHTQHVLALEQEVQRLQFELQACHNHAAGTQAAEEEERSRSASELGQVSVCSVFGQGKLGCVVQIRRKRSAATVPQSQASCPRAKQATPPQLACFAVLHDTGAIAGSCTPAPAGVCAAAAGG